MLGNVQGLEERPISSPHRVSTREEPDMAWEVEVRNSGKHSLALRYAFQHPHVIDDVLEYLGAHDGVVVDCHEQVRRASVSDLQALLREVLLRQLDRHRAEVEANL